MKISRINMYDQGTLKAFLDIETQEGFILKGFKIVDGANGPFVSFPSQKNKDGEYNDTVWADKELRAEVTKIGLEKYSNELSVNAPKEQVVSNENVSDDIPF